MLLKLVDIKVWVFFFFFYFSNVNEEDLLLISLKQGIYI